MKVKNSCIVLVGTHADECSKQHADEVLSSLKQRFGNQNQIPIDDYFAVSTVSGQGVSFLLRRLTLLAELRNMVFRRVPTNYLFLERYFALLCSMRSQNSCPIISFNQFQELCNEFDIPNAQEVGQDFSIQMQFIIFSFQILLIFNVE